MKASIVTGSVFFELPRVTNVGQCSAVRGEHAVAMLIFVRVRSVLRLRSPAVAVCGAFDAGRSRQNGEYRWVGVIDENSSKSLGPKAAEEQSIWRATNERIAVPETSTEALNEKNRCRRERAVQQRQHVLLWEVGSCLHSGRSCRLTGEVLYRIVPK